MRLWSYLADASCKLQFLSPTIMACSSEAPWRAQQDRDNKQRESHAGELLMWPYHVLTTVTGHYGDAFFRVRNCMHCFAVVVRDYVAHLRAPVCRAGEDGGVSHHDGGGLSLGFQDVALQVLWRSQRGGPRAAAGRAAEAALLQDLNHILLQHPSNTPHGKTEQRDRRGATSIKDWRNTLPPGCLRPCWRWCCSSGWRGGDWSPTPAVSAEPQLL